MEEAIEPWRLVVCKREKPPREDGDERPASSRASPLAGWLHKGWEPSLHLGPTAPPGGQRKKRPQSVAAWSAS